MENVHDPRATPDLVPCPNCSTRWPMVWWQGSERFAGRWVQPKLSPCPNCSIDESAALKRRIDDDLVRAGFPSELLGFELSARGVEVQPDGLAEESFQRGLLRREGRTVGILRRNLEALRQLYAWKPPQWALLHGPVGTGKSTIMAAMARKLHPGGVMHRFYIDGERPERVEDELEYDRSRPTAMHRPKIPEMRYRRLDHLIAQHEDRFGRHTRSPVKAMSKFEGVLFLDELGINEQPRKVEIEVVSHIIGERSDRQRCTVVATNNTLEQLQELYDARVYDRLRQAIRVPLTGPSWRPDGDEPEESHE